MRSLKSDKTLIQFVEKLREGVYITAASGDIIDCNPAFLEMFGVRSLQELLSVNAFDCVQRRCVFFSAWSTSHEFRHGKS